MKKALKVQAKCTSAVQKHGMDPGKYLLYFCLDPEELIKYRLTDGDNNFFIQVSSEISDKFNGKHFDLYLVPKD